MHILMVSEYFPPHEKGGGELSAFALAKALVKHGVTVSVLTSRFPDDEAQRTQEGVTVYARLVTGKTPDSLQDNLQRGRVTKDIMRELPKLIADIKPDIVHAMNITSMPGVAHVAQDIGIPAVAHINSPLAFDPKGTLLDNGKERQTPYTFGSFVSSFTRAKEVGRIKNKWFLRWNPVVWTVLYRRWNAIRDSFAAFTHFFPISTVMQEWLVKYGVPTVKTTVLYNIIPLDAFAHEKTVMNKTPKLLYLGGYARYKGLPIIIEALQGITGYTLDCYGAGEEKAVMQAQATQAGVNAHFFDYMPPKDIPKLMASHDMLLFPSQVPEGLGRLAIEAMAGSKPVIASDIGGMRDTVVQGKTGLLVPPTDVAAWSSAIRELLSDAKKRKAFGVAGKKRAFALFSEESIFKTALAAYEKVLS
ncbi:glycosyltransferase family 4 protein [Candidatus Woesearchaeota archaeon]|nr:glycosyltransferase family 4 protein [Candidatus Woesearchaeota archaeon]